MHFATVPLYIGFEDFGRVFNSGNSKTQRPFLNTPSLHTECARMVFIPPREYLTYTGYFMVLEKLALRRPEKNQN